MEKLKQIVFNRFYFCILFMLSSLSATIPTLLRFQSFNKIFLVWGFVILLHDVLTVRNCLFNRYKWILWAMLIVYGIAAILNFRYMTISNLSAVAYLALHFLLMNQYDPQMKKEQVYKEMRILTNIFLIFTFFMTVIALGMFVIQYEHSYKAMYDGELADFTMGIYQGQRLQGVYANPNELGAASLLSVMFSILNVCLCKRVGQKFWWVYIVNGILSFLTLLLSLSRASQLTLLAFVFLMACFCGRTYLIQKRNMVKRLASVAIAMVIGLGSTVAVFIFMQGTKSICAKVPALYEQLINTGDDEPGSEHPSGPVIIDRTEGEDVGNGRITLWKIGFQVWKTNPLFGVGFQKGIDRAKISGIESPFLNISGGFHNIYVEAFVGGGLIGGILFLAYWVMASQKAFSFVAKVKQFTVENSIVIVLIAITGALLCFGMFEYILISPGGFIAVPFWTMLGYVNYFIMGGNQRFSSRKKTLLLENEEANQAKN